VSTNSEFIILVGDVRSVFHLVRGILEGALHLTLLVLIQLGLWRFRSRTWLPFGGPPLRRSVSFRCLLRVRNGLSLGLVVRLLMQLLALRGTLARCLVFWCFDLGGSVHGFCVHLLLLGGLGGLFVRLPFSAWQQHVG